MNLKNTEFSPQVFFRARRKIKYKIHSSFETLILITLLFINVRITQCKKSKMKDLSFLFKEIRIQFFQIPGTRIF